MLTAVIVHCIHCILMPLRESFHYRVSDSLNACELEMFQPTRAEVVTGEDQHRGDTSGTRGIAFLHARHAEFLVSFLRPARV